MNWIERITRTISTGDIDHKRFERTACALLQAQYPGLSPVEGGTDLGRDADVYDPAALREGPRGRLLVTTGDPVKNVTNGLSRMREEGISADYLVIACSRPISAKTRQRLEQRCESAGVGTPHIFGRDWIVPLLARDPNWTEYLLGFRGRVSALVESPLERHDDETALIAREGIVESLRLAAQSGGDVVVSGVPGSGKSRVIAELSGTAFFLDPRGITYVLDDLQVMAPGCVVVDDAHLHPEAVRQLLAIREQEGLSFGVVAATWPAELESVRSQLVEPSMVEVGLMRRDDMDTIVQAHGVTGYRARYLVLEQADGRPGWALTLAKTLIAGNGRDVASGAVLLEQVVRHIQSNADSAVTLDAVACLAALGSADIDDLGRISHLVGVPQATLVASLRSAATDGLLTLENGRWRLQPGLSGALVNRWFFDETRTRSWDSLTQAFPDRQHDLTNAMLKAAKTAPTGEVHGRIDQWVHALPPTGEWNEDTLRLVRSYSALTEQSASFAARSATEILGRPRQLETCPWGTLRDPIGDAARKQLKRCVQQWFDPDAVKGTLSLALEDERTRHNHTDHAMRVLGDMTGHLGPDGESYFETRRILLEIATAWVSETDVGGNDRTAIWAEAVALAFSPDVEGTWSLPGRIRTIQIADGIESPPHLAELIDLWDDVDQFLGHLAGGLSAAAVQHLLKLWDEWLRLAGGIARRQAKPSDDQQAAGVRGVWSMYSTIYTIVAAHPGLALRAQRALDLAARWQVIKPDHLPDLPLDPDLVLLAGRRDFHEDVHQRMATREEEVTELANRLAALEPHLGAARFVALEAEGELLGNGSGAWQVAHRIAGSVPSRTYWLKEAVRLQNRTLIAHLLTEVHRRGELLDPAPFVLLLRESEFRGAIIGAAFDGPTSDLTREVLDSLQPDDSAHIENTLLYRDEADDLAHTLLCHSVAEIAETAALCFRMGTEHGMPLPPEWDDDWERAFLSGTLLYDRNSMMSYRQTEVLKRLAVDNPDLCVRWFERLLDVEDVGYNDLADLHEVAKALPSEGRRRVAALVPGSHLAFTDLLLPLCGEDDTMVAELIADGVDPDYFLLVLRGHLDTSGENIGTQLLDAGVSPNRVAHALISSRSWAGDESDDLARMIDWFTALRARQPRLLAVADAALPALHAERERALAEEGDEAIRGYR